MRKMFLLTALVSGGLLLLLSLLPYTLSGQSIQVNKDSLLQIWHSPPGSVPDSIRRHAGFKLQVAYSRGNFDSLLLINREMEAMALATKTPLWAAYANHGHVRYYHSLGKSDSAILSAQKGIQIATGVDTAILAETYLMLGAIWDVRGDPDSAIHYNQVALEMFLKNKNYISAGRAYANIGSAHHRKMEYIKALEYYEKAQRYCGDRTCVSLFVNSGYLLHQLMQYDEAMSNFEQALRIAERSQDALSMIPACAGMATVVPTLNEVRAWVNKGIHLCDSLNQLLHRPRLFFVMGMRYRDSLQLDTAEYYLTKCRAEAMMGGDKMVGVTATTYLTDVYAEKGLCAKSLMYSREVLPYLEQMKLDEYLMIVYKSMSKCLAAAGQYQEAFFFLSKKDSLNDIQEREQLSNSILKEYIEYKNDQEKEYLKQSKILAEVQASKLREETQNRYLIIGLLATILLCIIILQMIRVRFKDRAARALAKVNLDLKVEQGHLQHTNNKLRQFSSIVSHDILGNLDLMLSTGHILVGARPTQEGLTQYYEATQRTSRQLKEYCLRLLQEAQSPANEGLSDPMPIVRMVLDRLEPSLNAAQLQVELNDLSPTKIPPALTEQVFQNLISNALRYAGTASQPMLRISEASDAQGQIAWVVEDNGPGLSPERREAIFAPTLPAKDTNSKGTNRGLYMLKSALQDVGADIQETGKADSGARFIVTLPV